MGSVVEKDYMSKYKAFERELWLLESRGMEKRLDHNRSS